MFLFEKFNKNVQFNSLFLGNSLYFYLYWCKIGYFLSEVCKMLSIWSSVLFTVSALEMCERKACRKQTESNVSLLPNKISALEHDLFMQVLL